MGAVKPDHPSRGAVSFLHAGEEGRRELRRFVMFVRDNGPIISLGIGTTCVVAFALLTESTLHKLGFLALALLGVGLMAGISWARKHMAELSKPPDTGA